MNEPSRSRRWLLRGLVFALALAALLATLQDFGLTWDEPAYFLCQMKTVGWWKHLATARTQAELAALVGPDRLLEDWPYGRFGLCFHPPLAGQLSTLTHALFRGWVGEIAGCRVAPVVELALAVAILFAFLERRYGVWVGGVAAAALLLMPRVYGDGHIAGTDMPGLLIWTATALAAWKGLNEPHGRRWRVATGVLLGLAFVTKANALLVVLPLVVWLALTRLDPRRLGWADWIDGLVSTTAMLLPLYVAWAEVRRLAHIMAPPTEANLYDPQPATTVPATILLVPLAAWMLRRGLGWVRRGSPIWGVERPALESLTAMLAFAPPIAWLGNPAWWRETMPRLAHYYALSAGRRGTLPEIPVLYFGQAYYYNLPWHNGWVLIGITVPATLLIAGAIGLMYALRVVRRDRLPVYFVVHLVTLPCIRMLETPAHDGVRLFLPTFVFLAALVGWGTLWVADGLARLVRMPGAGARAAFAALVLLPAGVQLVRIHPYELSYYNELIGGPRGAWRRGCELTYWFDALNPPTLAQIQAVLPRNVHLRTAEGQATPLFYFEVLQYLGHLRRDLRLERLTTDEFPYVWLLTNDSKAGAYSRLLFALRPWYASRPRQLRGLRVITVADPDAAARAWALQLLVDRPVPGPRRKPARAPLPPWLHRMVPWLGRFWGEGLTPLPPLGINEPLMAWVHDDPRGLLAAARQVAAGALDDASPDVGRLMGYLTERDKPDGFPSRLVRHRSRRGAILEAVQILVARPEAVRAVLLRYPFTNPDDVGGYLDRDLSMEARERDSAAFGPAADRPL
jgi:4-amino-4-deoxy-L-arabinose transferase-like glycosyltransferase